MKNKKVLILYYSLQGFTEEVAGIIKEITKGDLYKIEPKNPYNTASAYTMGLFHAKTGHAPPLKKNSIDFDSYDLIFMGAPVWWFTLTPPILSFIKENNLKNKIIIPFCTHKGNFGNYFEKFKEQHSTTKIIKESDFYNAAKQNERELSEKVKKFVNLALDV